MLRAFKPVVCQAHPSVLKGVQDCRLPGVKRLKPLKPLKRSAAASTRHSGHSPLLLRAFEPVVCQAQPSVLKGVQAASTRHSGHSPLLLRVFNPAVCQASNPYQRAVCQAYNPYNPAWQLRPGTQAEPSVVKGVQACRLPETLKPCVAASTRHSGHSPLLLRAFKPAVCQATFSFPSYFLRAFFSGTCQCFFWHRFPAGVSCVTAIRPRECDDRTTVEQTGQLCA